MMPLDHDAPGSRPPPSRFADGVLLAIVLFGGGVLAVLLLIARFGGGSMAKTVALLLAFAALWTYVAIRLSSRLRSKPVETPANRRFALAVVAALAVAFACVTWDLDADGQAGAFGMNYLAQLLVPLSLLLPKPLRR
ncbi:MAG: hypothetical protein JNL90_11010 [Planctomycetes bacterium]|nr:hypothetical protein [Planctomycetota bacterium]